LLIAISAILGPDPRPLKNFGLVIGRAKMNTITLRAGDLLVDRPELAAAVEPLLQAREAVGRQIVEVDGRVRRLTKASEPVRRLMTAPVLGRSRRCAISPPSMIPHASGNRAMSAPISA
jgi:transposase